ncbi:hypothetical protein, partial [Klebsiella pneumoniae]|uniref:hypothetical protein n=1 Tax=Klebsiella pneumoniae TaxID=573 RepID=UPI003853FCDA
FAAEAGLSALINPETVRAALAHAALRATGRELVITGPMHLRLGLAPGFAAEGIALANPPGFSRPEMATAKRLTARVALFS